MNNTNKHRSEKSFNKRTFFQTIEEQTLNIGDKVKFTVGGITHKTGLLVGLSNKMGKIYTPRVDKQNQEDGDVSPETSEWFTLFTNRYGKQREPAGIVLVKETKLNKVDFSELMSKVGRA